MLRPSNHRAASDFATRVFGARARHAAARASRATSRVARESCTRVAPWRPQAPFTGEKISGAAFRNASCSSGGSFTIAHPGSGESVAKIFPPTRKSG